jgi:hypothetical protein
MKPEQKLFFIAHRIYQNGANPTAWVIREEMDCTFRFAEYWLDEWRKNHPDPEIKNQVRERPRKKP